MAWPAVQRDLVHERLEHREQRRLRDAAQFTAMQEICLQDLLEDEEGNELLDPQRAAGADGVADGLSGDPDQALHGAAAEAAAAVATQASSPPGVRGDGGGGGRKQAGRLGTPPRLRAPVRKLSAVSSMVARRVGSFRRGDGGKSLGDAAAAAARGSDGGGGGTTGGSPSPRV